MSNVPTTRAHVDDLTGRVAELEAENAELRSLINMMAAMATVAADMADDALAGDEEVSPPAP